MKRMKCMYCKRMFGSLVGSYGFYSCSRCYSDMIAQLLEKYPREMITISKTEKAIKRLEEKKKRMVSEIKKQELKDLEEER